jgi:hypothetical protein
MHRRLLALLLIVLGGACSKPVDDAAPVATPTVTVAARAVPIESPVDISYTFVVAPSAPKLSQNYRVFVHFNDSSGRQLWTDDHVPPKATSEWQPGETITYTRTMFVPKVPYTGQTAIDLGLYLVGSDERVPLSGTAVGRRAYRVGALEVLPQRDATQVQYNAGWHDAEVVPDSPGIEWRWSKGESTLQFRNPRRDMVLMVDLDQPQADLSGPQQVEFRAGSTPVDSFRLQPGERVVRRIAIPAATLGESDNVELIVRVQPTFSPAYLPAAQSRDVRTLGVRVFHAYIQPK